MTSRPGPAPHPIAQAVHGHAPAVPLIHHPDVVDPAAAQARWVTTLEGIHDVQVHEQQRSAATEWRTIDQVMTGVVAGWCEDAGLRFATPRRHRRSNAVEAALREQPVDVLQNVGRATVKRIAGGYRSPDQRMFDALERHDHPALRRALAAGANVQARFLPDRHDNGRRHGGAHGFPEPVEVTGQKPVFFAVLEDDVIALRTLLDAGAPRSDAGTALNALADQGVVRDRVRCFVETLELRKAAEEAGPVRPRTRVRI